MHNNSIMIEKVCFILFFVEIPIQTRQIVFFHKGGRQINGSKSNTLSTKQSLYLEQIDYQILYKNIALKL